MKTNRCSLFFSYFGLLAFVIQDAVGASMCNTTTLTDKLRNIVLDQHNAYRTQLATGKSMIKGGKLAASAKNMYKLVRFLLDKL